MPREKPRTRSTYWWIWLVAIVLAIALLTVWYLRRPTHEEKRPPMLPTTEWTAAPKAGGVAVDLPAAHASGEGARTAATPTLADDESETADPVATPLPAQ